MRAGAGPTHAARASQVASREVTQKIHVPGLPEREDVHVLNAGFQFASDGPGVEAAPPRLGEHTDAVLAELGFDAEERDALRTSGAAYADRAT
jgi:CoA:oxalate CoA-transferase